MLTSQKTEVNGKINNINCDLKVSQSQLVHSTRKTTTIKYRYQQENVIIVINNFIRQICEYWVRLML